MLVDTEEVDDAGPDRPRKVEEVDDQQDEGLGAVDVGQRPGVVLGSHADLEGDVVGLHDVAALAARFLALVHLDGNEAGGLRVLAVQVGAAPGARDPAGRHRGVGGAVPDATGGGDN